LFSGVGLILLLLRALPQENPVYLVSAAVFGTSLITLYGASTLYHSAKSPVIRSRWRTVDHAAIYVLIAGTYTPFTLIILSGTVGWSVFAVSWSFAAVGITLKLFFTGRFQLLSTAMYVLMGWMIVFVIKPLIDAFAGPGMIWLFAGGIAYTVGAVLYSTRLPYGHAIFHVFVLAGSLCHFIAVYEYVLPAA